MKQYLEDTFIKHKRFLDVCFHVEDCFFLEDTIEINGSWLNQGFVESWYLNERQTFQIKRDELVDWLVCTKMTDSCLRNCKWDSISGF